MQETSKDSSSTVTAYYYFDFNNTSATDVGNVLRSLVKQVCVGANQIPKVVEMLCSQYRASGQHPSVAVLVSTLRILLQELDAKAYLALDALDEYPEAGRPALLRTLQSMTDPGYGDIYIFVASREEHDIGFCLSKLATETISIHNFHVDADIRLYTHACLANDPGLSRLPDHMKSIIESKLSERAHGMSVGFSRILIALLLPYSIDTFLLLDVILAG